MIKHKRLSWLLLILVIIGSIFYACRDDNWSNKHNQNEIQELTVDAARDWYQTNNLPVMELRNNTTEVGIVAKPKWEQAKASKKERYQIVETPLMTKGRSIFLDADTKRRMDKKADAKKIRNTSRMVIIKDMETGKIINFIMIFVGTYDYLKKSNTMGKNSYFKREKDYCGKVLFYTPKGVFVNGWKYENDKIVGQISKSSSEKFVQLRGGYEDCHEEANYVEQEYCGTTGYIDAELGFIETGEECVDAGGYWEYYQVCEWIGDGGDGYIDDDYWNDNTENPDPGSSTSKAYALKSTDKISKADLPTTMSKQIPNTCVSSIMEYINNKVYGGDVNEGTYIKFYLQHFGINIFADGVSLDNIGAFVSQFFKTADFDSKEAVIDSGGVIMADISGTSPNDIHNVLIIGYTSKGDFIYMDPELGYLQTRPESSIGQTYTIYITGNR